ncbi:MAG TPA: hypothetical protein VNQ77_17010 [Frankiaceae bacterium]|nr:hypothetical protein [Frankiaceae bacterium]
MRPAVFARATLALAAGALSLTALPAPAATRPPVPGAERFGDGWAVPVSTDGPAWYDAAFHRRVMAAGRQGVRLPAGVPAPQAVGMASTGIRPGTWLVTVTTDPVGFAWCTANFVFKKRSTYGLGTAGHCAAKDAIGAYPDVTAYVVPPAGQGAPGFYHIGKFVLSRDNGVGEDFAMISIYPQYASWMNPTMPVWGGPTGVYTSTAPTVVKHFGHGLVVGTGGTPRAGVAPVWDAVNGKAFAWYGAGLNGDSGSAVNVATGEGAGNFTHIVLYDEDGEILPGMLAGTKLTYILKLAKGWTLVPGSMVPTP